MAWRLSALDRINMTNKVSSTKRFRTDTAITFNHSTNYLDKHGKTTANYNIISVEERVTQ